MCVEKLKIFSLILAFHFEVVDDLFQGFPFSINEVLLAFNLFFVEVAGVGDGSRDAPGYIIGPSEEYSWNAGH